MPRFAMLFPGQGAQSVGMLAELAERYPVVGQTYAEASEALDYDLASLISAGPAEKLDQTEFTQPALVAAETAIWRVWQQLGGAAPALLAGHSLGEYSALVAAGVLDFGDALRLTRLRGRAMQAAVAAGAGAMTAIVGLDDDAVCAVCAEAEAEHAGDALVASPANFNAPMQVVIAGHSAAVETAGHLARERGAKLVKPLAVSVPSHCALMAPAAEQLQSYLQDVPLHPPKLPVLHNIDARPRDDVDDIREALVRQLAQSVLWADIIRAMRQADCELFFECGPGKVLAGLNKRIDKAAQSLPLSDTEGLQQALAATSPRGDAKPDDSE